MQIDITGLTEDTVVAASAELEDAGFQYDEDFTTLYGFRWTITGMRFTNVAAAQAVLPKLA